MNRFAIAFGLTWGTMSFVDGHWIVGALSFGVFMVALDHRIKTVAADIRGDQT
jgi:hypothetical protein